MTFHVTQLLPRLLGSGGAERVAALERQGLVKRGFRVSTAGFDGDIRVRSTGSTMGGPGPLNRLVRHAADVMDPLVGTTRQPDSSPSRDLLHVHLWQTLSLSSVLMLADRGPIVWTLHDYSLICPRASLTKRKGDPCSSHPLCYLRASVLGLRLRGQKIHFVSPSLFVLEKHRGAFPWINEKNSSVIFNPVSGPLTPAPPREKDAQFVAGFLGKRTREKGFRMYEDVIETAGVSGLVAGKGIEVTKPHLIRNLGELSPSELDYAFWPLIDLLIVPSQWPENAPLVVAEALSRGVPVVASNIGGVPEMLAGNAWGALVSGTSTSEFVQAIHWLEDPERLRLASESARSLSRKYSIERHVNQLIETYEIVMT